MSAAPAGVPMTLSYSALMPPALFIVLCLVGALLALAWRRLGLALSLAASLCLYASSLPVVATLLLRHIEAALPRHADYAGAQAIVVLGGDMNVTRDPEFPDTLGPLSTERVVWGAELHRRLQLPVAVTGGGFRGARDTLGGLMKAMLEQDLATPVRWTEDRSETTFENALYTARLLQRDGIATVIVVTQAFHMPRALWSFERVGLHALPAPVPRTPPSALDIGDFLPSTHALQETFYALHEIVGLQYYRLRD